MTAVALLAFNEAVKVAFARFGVRAPHTLGGMLIVILVTFVLKAASEPSGRLTDAVVDFFGPLRDWVARWMPVFFVPSLITLPQAVSGLPASQAVKVAQVTAGGWLLSLALAGLLVKQIRGAVHTEITTDEVWRACCGLALCTSFTAVAAAQLRLCPTVLPSYRPN